MKIQLKKNIIEQAVFQSQFQINRLVYDGLELEKKLKYYLSKFTEGIMDPDIAGKSPDRFINKLQNGVLGDYSNRYITIAYDKDDVIGILIGLPREERQLHIYSLHVSREYRSRGVGSALLSKCVNDMYINNIREIVLDVHIDNKPAFHLYKKFGFA